MIVIIDTAPNQASVAESSVALPPEMGSYADV